MVISSPTRWDPHTLFHWAVVPAGVLLRALLAPSLPYRPVGALPAVDTGVLEVLREAIHISFRPLLVSPQHDPELLTEGMFLYDLGRSPFGGRGESPVRSSPLYLLLAAGESPRVGAFLCGGSWPDWFLRHDGAMWLQRSGVFAADVAAAVMLYNIAARHAPLDGLRRRAQRIARWTWQRTVQQQQQPKRQERRAATWSAFSDAHLPLLVGAMYLLHPFVVAAAAVGSTEGIAHCVLVAAVWAAMRTGSGPAATSVAYLALSAACAGCAGYLDPFYFLYLPPLLALVRNRWRPPISFLVRRRGEHAASSLKPLGGRRSAAAAVCLYAALAVVVFCLLACATSLALASLVSRRCHRPSPKDGSAFAALSSLLPRTLSLPGDTARDAGEPRCLDWSWLGPTYGRLLGGASSDANLLRPTIGLSWYLDAICFEDFRGYFKWLATAQLHVFVAPLVAALSCLPSADEPAGYSSSSSSSSVASGLRPIGARDAAQQKGQQDGQGSGSTALLRFPLRRGSCGALAIVSVLCILWSILHPFPTLRTHATALAMLALHPSLLLGRLVGEDGHAALAPLLPPTPPQSDGDAGDCADDAVKEAGDATTRLPLQPMSQVRAVIAVGTPLVTTGMFLMWWLWVVELGRGNSNYFYFQCLAFHAFQALLACAFVASAVRRLDSISYGERRAQSQICCAARRWLLQQRRLAK